MLNTREVGISAWYVTRVRDLTLSIIAGTVGDVKVSFVGHDEGRAWPWAFVKQRLEKQVGFTRPRRLLEIFSKVGRRSAEISLRFTPARRPACLFMRNGVNDYCQGQTLPVRVYSLQRSPVSSKSALCLREHDRR